MASGFTAAAVTSAVLGVGNRAWIMASATPAADIPGKELTRLRQEKCGDAPCHADWPKVADAVITAAARAHPSDVSQPRRTHAGAG
jgi:hypothetical protein